MEILKFTEKSLLFQCLKSSDLITKKVNEALIKSGLNFNQALILIIIHSEKKNSVTPGVLVDVLNLPKSVISQLLSSLEEEKLIKRKVDLKDARKFILNLTAKGKQRVHQSIKFIDVLDKDIERNFTKNELTTLLKLLNKVQ